MGDTHGCRVLLPAEGLIVGQTQEIEVQYWLMAPRYVDEIWIQTRANLRVTGGQDNVSYPIESHGALRFQVQSEKTGEAWFTANMRSTNNNTGQCQEFRLTVAPVGDTGWGTESGGVPCRIAPPLPVLSVGNVSEMTIEFRPPHLHNLEQVRVTIGENLTHEGGALNMTPPFTATPSVTFLIAPEAAGHASIEASVVWKSDGVALESACRGFGFTIE